jgi:hypothetical protein
VSRVYFTDRDLGKRFPEILTAAGLTVERHHHLFPPDGPDEQWLEHCGRNARVALTHNERIRYTPNELAAVIAHRVALLIVIGKVPLAELIMAQTRCATTRTMPLMPASRRTLNPFD